MNKVVIILTSIIQVIQDGRQDGCQIRQNII